MVKICFNRKGAAHFEMVISFIFFMGFVFFLFFVLKPYSSSTLNEFAVNGLHDSFEESVKTNLTEMFLRVGFVTPGNCFESVLPDRLFERELSNSRVFSLDGTISSSKLKNNPDSLDSHKLFITGTDSFYIVMASPEFFVNLFQGEYCDTPTSQFGNIIEREVLSNSSLTVLSGRYYFEYETLREELNIPGIFDFSITSEDFPDLDMAKEIPSSSEVMAKSYLMEVLYSNGTLINSIFTFKIW